MPSSAGARTLAFASAAGIAAASITAAWFAVGHLKTAEQQRVWVVHTRQGRRSAHFYESILQALCAPMGSSRDMPQGRTGRSSARQAEAQDADLR